MHHVLCVVNPASCAATSIAKATLGDLFTSLTTWILSSVQWFITGVGHVLTTASEPTTVIHAANGEFKVLMPVAPVLMLLGLVVATVQALQHGDHAALWRVYLGVAPTCVLGITMARPVATLILEAVNQLSSTAAGTVGAHEARLVADLSQLNVGTPGFGLFLLGVGVVVGAWLLWCELIVRTVVLTLLIVVVPVIVPLSILPSGRRLGWRLLETFLAISVSKFLIVVTLSLGLDELTGSSATQVITGAVTLILATASPFVLLRVIPFVEQSAMHNLEGIRSRFTRTVTGAPSSPLVAAAQAMAPAAPIPGPPERPADLGLGMWESTSTATVPEPSGTPLPPPIGKPTLRGGHVAYRTDDIGPIVGWHFDE